MRVAWILMVAMVALATQGTLGAESERLSDDALSAIRFDQKLGQQLSLNLPFLDEQGRTIALGDCMGRKPTILVFGYYGCPMLCTLVLNGLISGLQDLQPSVGEKFSIIFVSVDPSETPALAAEKKKNYVKLYGRSDSAGGWHFLTGSQESIQILCRQAGFRYLFDPASRQFAHPSGIIVLTSQGQVSRYLFGINFAAADLSRALKVAGSDGIGSKARQFFYLCFHYNPIRSKYGSVIMLCVRISGVATLAGLAGIILLARRSGRSHSV